jgi:hypothetical protein
MTDISDQQFLTTLQAAGGVPGSASQALPDPTWAWLFEVWAREPRVDYVTALMASLARMSVDPAVSYFDLRMEAFTGQRDELYSSQTRLAFDDLDNEGPARASLLADAARHAEIVWGDFRLFVHTTVGGDPADAPVDWATVYDEVDAVNQPALKDLQPGESIRFWQSGPLVLLGDGHKEGYYALVGGKGSPAGTVSMDKKGSLVGTGKISAVNSPDPAAFDEAIARFSKKRVVHGDDHEDDGEAVTPDQGLTYGSDEGQWAFYQQCADAIAQHMSAELNVGLTWSAEAYLDYKAVRATSMRTQGRWPEMLDAAREAGIGTEAAWDKVDAVIDQNGW